MDQTFQIFFSYQGSAFDTRPMRFFIPDIKSLQWRSLILYDTWLLKSGNKGDQPGVGMSGRYASNFTLRRYVIYNDFKNIKKIDFFI